VLQRVEEPAFAKLGIAARAELIRDGVPLAHHDDLTGSPSNS